MSGITSLSDSKEIGKTLVKSMALFYALTILALITGLVAVTVMQPGVGMNIDPAHLDKAVAASYAKQAAPKGFVEFVLHIIPNAFFGAFAEGEVLPVLLLAIICGFGLTKIGVAFAHEDGKGFNIVLDCFPVDGKIALREPKAKEEGGNG